MLSLMYVPTKHSRAASPHEPGEFHESPAESIGYYSFNSASPLPPFVLLCVSGGDSESKSINGSIYAKNEKETYILRSL